MSYQFTRPDADQVKFTSDRTGEHVLEVYLQNAEMGNRTLSSLLADLFNPSGTLKGAPTPGDVLACQDFAAAALLSATQAAISAARFNGDFVVSVGGAIGVVTLKTINGTALTGSGDVFLKSPDALLHLLNVT